jgi:hypothetical protein
VQAAVIVPGWLLAVSCEQPQVVSPHIAIQRQFGKHTTALLFVSWLVGIAGMCLAIAGTEAVHDAGSTSKRGPLRVQSLVVVVFVLVFVLELGRCPWLFTPVSTHQIVLMPLRAMHAAAPIQLGQILAY